MTEQNGGWIEILSVNDIESLWAKLFKLVSRHSAIRNLFESRKIARDRLQDLHTDLTQDLFLRLYQKGRLQHYLDAGYSNADVEHELYDIEIPNLVSLLLRERHPETYRMARRISTLLRTSPEFQPHQRQASCSGAADGGATNLIHKLALRVYGLKSWSHDKPIKSSQSFLELIKEIPFRNREIRRTGRGSGSQVIISNSDLKDLIVEVFKAIDSPADVRTVRSLVLSKLAVEDLQFVSIEAELIPMGSAEAELLKLDFADERPTPEELLQEKEVMWEIDAKLEQLLDRMNKAVRNKPRRYKTLLQVAWHCYFDPSTPSQTRVAKAMGISPSLVTHYRKIFDNTIHDLRVSNEAHAPLITALSNQLSTMVSEMAKARGIHAGEKIHPPVAEQKQRVYVKAMTAAATAGRRGASPY